MSKQKTNWSTVFKVGGKLFLAGLVAAIPAAIIVTVFGTLLGIWGYLIGMVLALGIEGYVAHKWWKWS